ncbi:30S ribosomal protein S4 [Patescibacteria group bacterium]|nr:MAG: 30S ribosomal protein S4 [Patescibacteria group bacterium]
MVLMLDSKCAQCRGAGVKLMLKGEKCFGPKCTMVKRNYPPGAHGPSKKHSKRSVYGKQLFEKQKAKRLYGLRERQFANYVAEAAKKTGNTGKFLISYLESRLDNVAFRMGLGKSRAAARQIVSHSHLSVNGRPVNIPSYRVKVGDMVALKESKKKSLLYDKMEEKLAKLEAPGWLGLEPSQLRAKILNAPTIAEPGFDAKTIIEFYSR